ncbi:MAG: DUF2269 family protein [Chloroflexota bacterium]
MSTIDELFLFAHVIAALVYVAGLTAVQISLIRAMQSENTGDRSTSFDEASHYQGMLLVPGAIGVAATGLFLWSEQLDYNMFTTGWLIFVELCYIVTLLICLPFIGMGLRRARIAALQARRKGRSSPELDAVMTDNVPLFFAGIATLLVPVAAAFSVFRPF